MPEDGLLDLRDLRGNNRRDELGHTAPGSCTANIPGGRLEGVVVLPSFPGLELGLFGREAGVTAAAGGLLEGGERLEPL